MNVLNENQVKELFQREAVFINKEDTVPVSRAIELFGNEAVEYATSQSFSGRYYNDFSVGGGNLKYLYRWGFYAAASYYNVQRLLRIPHDKEGLEK